MKTVLAAPLLALAVTAAVSAHPAVSVVVDRQGTAYYSDLKQVWRVAPDGSKAVAVANVHTHELYLDAEGNLFGEHVWYEGERTDKWRHYVWRRSPNGRVVKIIPDREGFLQNYSFVRDGAGSMYLADRDRHRVERISPGGAKTVIATGLRDVRWMTATRDGTVHLIDGGDLVTIKPGGRAARVARDLATGTLSRFPVGARHALMGLWTDVAGNVYVAVHSEGKVRRIAPDGKVTVVLESPAGWSPTGGAFAPDGRLLLLEWGVTSQVRLRVVRGRTGPGR